MCISATSHGNGCPWAPQARQDVARTKEVLVHDDRRNERKRLSRYPQKWRAGARPGGLSFSRSSLPLFLFSLSLPLSVSPPPPFLGRAGGRGHSIPRAGAVALGNALSSMSVEGGCVCSLLFLSVSLSLFSSRPGVTMSPSALARLLRRCGWQRHRPRPDCWSLSVSLVLSDVSLSPLSLSFCLSVSLSFFISLSFL